MSVAVAAARTRVWVSCGLTHEAEEKDGEGRREETPQGLSSWKHGDCFAVSCVETNLFPNQRKKSGFKYICTTEETAQWKVRFDNLRRWPTKHLLLEAPF